MLSYLVFVAVSVAMVLTSISQSSIIVAFDAIRSSFSTSLVSAGWVLSIGQLVSCVSMPLAGKASDVFGRKNIFLLCMALFTVGSVLCAVAPSIEWLIVSRFIQGIGSGGSVPVSTGIVADQFPRSRQRVIGLTSSIFPIGQLIGPNLGGWLTTVYGWQSVFWVNIIPSLAVLLSAVVLLRPEPTKRQRIDFVGAGLLCGSIFSLMMAVTTLGNVQGAAAWLWVGVLFGTSIILMVALVRVEGKVRNPIIELEMLRRRPFLAANIYNFILGAVTFGMFSFVPLFAISVHQLSVLESGFILTPRSLGVLVVSAITSMYLVRWGYRRPILVGTLGVVLSLAILGIDFRGASILGAPVSATVVLLAVMLLAGVSLGLALPAANNACIELMPDRVGTITGIRGMFRQSGGAISVAFITLFLQHTGDMAAGFSTLYFALAVVLFLVMPLIYLMPKSCTELPPTVTES